jgi:hypothetical protein
LCASPSRRVADRRRSLIPVLRSLLRAIGSAEMFVVPARSQRGRNGDRPYHDPRNPSGRKRQSMTMDRRIQRDRRRRPTPGLSRYTFLGRRKAFRRKEDRERGGYVDRYSSKLFIAIVAILIFNFLDALLTTTILGGGGQELNPLVCSVIQLYEEKFWIWKFGIVSTGLILLCLHSKFGRVKSLIGAIASLYAAVVVYQIYLVMFR